MTLRPRIDVRRGERGTALVEFSIVAILLMLFIYAIATFGLLLAQKNSITQAAAEGARAALNVPGVAAPTDAQRITQATTTVSNSLHWLGSKYQASDTSATIAGCDSVSDPVRCITVVVTYPYASRPLIPKAPGIGLVTPNQIKATAVLRLS